MAAKTDAPTPTDDGPTRERNPSYDVFRKGDDDLWVPLGTDVQAPSRREAVVQAAAGLREEDRYGTFAVVRAGEFKTITRGRKVEPEDVWS